MISFGARYVDNAVAQKVFHNNKKESCRVSFVELNPNNLDDMEAVAITSENWGLPEYMEMICNQMQLVAKNHPAVSKKNKFYAITSQDACFSALQPSKVLAVCNVREDDEVRLSYLQVKPSYAGPFRQPFEYNHLGTSMLSSLKKLYHDKTLKLFSAPSAKPFYLANGFEQSEKCKSEFYYKA